MLSALGREPTVPVRPGRFPGRGKKHKQSPEVKVKQQPPSEMGVQTGDCSLAEGFFGFGILSYLIGITSPHPLAASTHPSWGFSAIAP